MTIIIYSTEKAKCPIILQDIVRIVDDGVYVKFKNAHGATQLFKERLIKCEVFPK